MHDGTPARVFLEICQRKLILFGGMNHVVASHITTSTTNEQTLQTYTIIGDSAVVEINPIGFCAEDVSVCLYRCAS